MNALLLKGAYIYICSYYDVCSGQCDTNSSIDVSNFCALRHTVNAVYFYYLVVMDRKQVKSIVSKSISFQAFFDCQRQPQVLLGIAFF